MLDSLSFPSLIVTDTAKMCFPGGSDGKESAHNMGDRVQSLGWEDLLEKGMAIHSSILAWRFTSTEEPGELQSIGPQNQT